MFLWLPIRVGHGRRLGSRPSTVCRRQKRILPLSTSSHVRLVQRRRHVGACCVCLWTSPCIQYGGIPMAADSVHAAERQVCITIQSARFRVAVTSLCQGFICRYTFAHRCSGAPSSPHSKTATYAGNNHCRNELHDETCSHANMCPCK